MMLMQARRMLDSGMGAEEMVNSEFEELYPGKVQNTQIAYDAKALTKHYDDFVKTKGKLETVLDKYQMKMERHKKLKKRETVILLLICLHQPQFWPWRCNAITLQAKQSV